MNKNTTIKDIASALDIHHTTVSRALRNHPDVNEDTRKLILKTAEKMNYLPNAFASGLRNNKSNVIGIMVPDIRPNFFSQTISHLTNLAFNRGYTVMICQSNEDYEVEKQNTLALLQNRVAGVIASVSYKTQNYDHFNMLEKQGIPIIYFDRIPKTETKNCIKIDAYHACMHAVNYLVSKGKKNIAFYAGIPEITVLKERLNGFKQAMKKNGMTLIDNQIIFGGIEETDGINAAKKILSLKKRPDAVICAVDKVALGMINSFTRNNISIPNEIAIIGFDNDPAGTIIYPSLTTLAQPIDEIAEQSFNYLYKRIEGEKIKESILLQMKLIIRESA